MHAGSEGDDFFDRKAKVENKMKKHNKAVLNLANIVENIANDGTVIDGIHF
jgi:hypothetical protein